MSKPFSTLPKSAMLKPTPFEAAISDSELSDLKQLLRLSPVGPKTYENMRTDRDFGLNHTWFSEAKKHWETDYDWRRCEAHINSFPNYMATIADDDGSEHTVHFAALFSERADAVPIVMLHGWPGSFLEFLGIFGLLKKKYSPKDLPYHVVAPSLIGYGYSSPPPTDRNWEARDTSRIINKMLVGIGFGSGYIAQGGDVGSFICRILAANYAECKAMHLNFSPIYGPKSKPGGIPEDAVTAAERKGLERWQDFVSIGQGYSKMHGTRPSTIGLVLSASPVALLAWIGEKFLVWSDTDPPLDTILDDVTLYWLTRCFPTSIYTYREQFNAKHRYKDFHGDAEYRCSKPFGYSWFPQEIMPCPVAWVKTTGNMVWHRRHTEGGHFAALEKPELLLQDLDDFIPLAWSGGKGASSANL